MHRQSVFGLWLLLNWLPAQAQPPEPPPLPERPRTREAMIQWIQEQAREGDLNCTVTLNVGAGAPTRLQLGPEIQVPLGSVLRGELGTFNGGPKVSLRTRLADPPLQVPLDQVARIEFRGRSPLPSLPPAKIQFRDGAWVLGAEITALDQQSLRFSTPYARDLEAPVGAIADLQPVEVVPAEEQPLPAPPIMEVAPAPPQAPPPDPNLFPDPAVAVVAPAPPQAPPPDQNTGRLWLTNGDVMSGQPVAIAEGSLTFRLRLGPEVQVPLGDVKRLSLPPQPWTPPATSPEKVSGRVTLITGEAWLGTVEKLDAQGLQLGWLGGKSVLLPLGLLHTLTELQQGILGLRQWAVAATASSEFGNPQWSAMQATGPPNTMQDGDYSTAWATGNTDGGPEWLELEYATPVHATRVRVRETYNPGAVVRIEGVADDGEAIPLWAGQDPTRQSPGWLEARFEPTQALLKKIRIHLDTALVPGWNEIDAVELIGTP